MDALLQTNQVDMIGFEHNKYARKTSLEKSDPTQQQVSMSEDHLEPEKHARKVKCCSRGARITYTKAIVCSCGAWIPCLDECFQAAEL